jgi:TolB protein
MSFDVFSSDPNPPNPQLHDKVLANANRRRARRRNALVCATTALLVAVVLPLALRDSGDGTDVRTGNRVASPPTDEVPSSVPAPTLEPPAGEVSTTTTTAALKKDPGPIVVIEPTTTTTTVPATTCTPMQRVEPTHRGRIAFTRQPKENGDTPRPARVFSLNGDGTDLKQLTDGDFDIQPAWSPDGDRIAFARDADLYVMKADGTNVHKVTDGPILDPAWSPDGRQITFVLQNPFGLAVVNVDGSGRQLLYETGDRVPNSPSWTPNGCRIVFGMCCTQRGLWSIRSDGTGLMQLLATGYEPSIRPDGKIAFYDSGAQTEELFVADADGSHVTALHREGVRPTWSADGTRIAFEHFTGKAWNIASVRADGSDFIAVTTTDTDFDLYADW